MWSACGRGSGYWTIDIPEGVPLVSCHCMLEPGSSCHFLSSIFLFGQSDFQVSKTIFDSREIIFLELLLLFWSSFYFLELLLGSSIVYSIWWRELGETPSDIQYIWREEEWVGLVEKQYGFVYTNLAGTGRYNWRNTQKVTLSQIKAR